jgi:hypothetical protein
MLNYKIERAQAADLVEMGMLRSRAYVGFRQGEGRSVLML